MWKVSLNLTVMINDFSYGWNHRIHLCVWKILLKDANTPVFFFYLLFYILSCQVHWVCVKWKRLYTIAYAQIQRHTTVRNISRDPWQYLWYFRVFHWHCTSLRQSWHCSYDITIKAEAANRLCVCVCVWLEPPGPKGWTIFQKSVEWHN